MKNDDKPRKVVNFQQYSENCSYKTKFQEDLSSRDVCLLAPYTALCVPSKCHFWRGFDDERN
jgi:hypothetical protein